MELQTLPSGKPALTSPTLADRIERLIRERTSGLIRSLRVDVYPGEVMISGRASTYYAKQLATHAALEAAESFALTNDIEVY